MKSVTASVFYTQISILLLFAKKNTYPPNLLTLVSYLPLFFFYFLPVLLFFIHLSSLLFSLKLPLALSVLSFQLHPPPTAPRFCHQTIFLFHLTVSIFCPQPMGKPVVSRLWLPSYVFLQFKQGRH